MSDSDLDIDTLPESMCSSPIDLGDLDRTFCKVRLAVCSIEYMRLQTERDMLLSNLVKQKQSVL